MTHPNFFAVLSDHVHSVFAFLIPFVRLSNTHPHFRLLSYDFPMRICMFVRFAFVSDLVTHTNLVRKLTLHIPDLLQYEFGEPEWVSTFGFHSYASGCFGFGSYAFGLVRVIRYELRWVSHPFVVACPLFPFASARFYCSFPYFTIAFVP